VSMETGCSAEVTAQRVRGLELICNAYFEHMGSPRGKSEMRNAKREMRSAKCEMENHPLDFSHFAFRISLFLFVLQYNLYDFGGVLIDKAVGFRGPLER
jgi:hypothetical protein